MLFTPEKFSKAGTLARKCFGHFLAGVVSCALVANLVLAVQAAESIGTLSAPLNDFSGNSVESLADSTSNESPLGNATADAVRLAAEADVVIICGGDFAGSIEAGEVYSEDVDNAFSDDRQLAVSQISPAQLKALLEFGLSNVVVGEDEYIDRAASSFEGYPHIAGFSLRYDPTAPVGDRVMSITMDDGERLALDDIQLRLKFCSTEHLLSGKCGFAFCNEYQLLGMTEVQALKDYIAIGITESYVHVNRVTEYGVNDNSIYSKIPGGLVFLIIAVCLLCNGQRFKKHFEFER